jgi:ABC-type multidrug transport system ATPase subunit
MTAMIATQDLTKAYGSARGIDGVTLEVAEGEVFGFLGPNGAGKTTTIRLLLGLLRPTRGRAAIGGLDCWGRATGVKRLVGYLPGEFTFDPSLRGAQIIAYLANLRGGVDAAYTRALIERVDLDPTRRFRDYSRGNKQKVGLVQAFMHRPRLLILDEPTSGLDPLNQQQFYALVDEVRRQGQTVFLSSHILPEVEHTCDRVGIIREGRLITVDHVATLKALKHHVVDIGFPAPASPRWFADLPAVESVTADDGGLALHLTVRQDLSEVLKVAAQHDATALSAHEPSLEEVFLRYYEPAQASAAPREVVAPGER